MLHIQLPVSRMLSFVTQVNFILSPYFYREKIKLTHFYIVSAASFNQWKKSSMLPPGGWNGWKPRITGAGVKFPLSDKLAVKLHLGGYCCTCCSHMKLRVSCTSHNTAEINGVKVLYHYLCVHLLFVCCACIICVLCM